MLPAKLETDPDPQAGQNDPNFHFCLTVSVSDYTL